MYTVELWDRLYAMAAVVVIMHVGLDLILKPFWGFVCMLKWPKAYWLLLWYNIMDSHISVSFTIIQILSTAEIGNSCVLLNFLSQQSPLWIKTHYWIYITLQQGSKKHYWIYITLQQRSNSLITNQNWCSPSCHLYNWFK